MLVFSCAFPFLNSLNVKMFSQWRFFSFRNLVVRVFRQVHDLCSCYKQLICVCVCSPVGSDCSVSWSVGRVSVAAAAAAGWLLGLPERVWRMTAVRLAAESRWTNGISCPNGGRMAHGKATITVDEYSSNPTQAFTHYNINQSRFQPPHVHM